MADDAERETRPDDPGEDRFAVLDVFGLTLEVSNPRIAELLTMDARQALTSDVKDLVGGAEVAEALPDAVVAVPTAKTGEDERVRREFRGRTDVSGQLLGFETRPDGVWISPGGLAVVTRVVEREVSLAAASHFVGEVAAHREGLAGPDSTALFVVSDQHVADVFKVAIRQRRVYHVVRTISVDNLEAIVGYVENGVLDHAHALVLLTPIENIDVGEVLSVIRSACVHE